MAITQQASKVRPNELYGGGSSGIATSFYKFEFEGPWDQVQYLIGSKVASGTPGEFKAQFAVTDEILSDTTAKAWLPRRNGVTYNDKSEFGWKDATFNGALTKTIGLAPSQGNNSIIHMATDVMSLPSIARADGKPGGILLVKVTQILAGVAYTTATSAGNLWDVAKGKPWHKEWRSTRINSDGIATLTALPSDGYNGGYEFPGFPIVTNNAATVPSEILLFTGDSRKSAAYMQSTYANQSRMAAASLSSPSRIITTVNGAGSGHSQTQYQAVAMDMINAGLRPTVVHVPGFSQNGFSNFSTFKANLDSFMAAVRAVSGLASVKFVLDTDYGVKGYPGDPRESQRLQCIDYAKSLQNGTTVFCFDSDPIITDYSVTTSSGVPMYAPYRVGGDDIHVGPPGLNVLAYGAGPSSSLTQTYASAFSVTNVPVIPGAPAIGTATPGALSASVTGTAPAATNGGAITGYRATSSPSGITATSATLPVNVTGLTAGTAYTFTLAAQNSAGYGPESFASNSVTPTSVPVADTTAPTLTAASGTTTGTTTASGAVTTDESGGTLYYLANTSATATASQVQAGASQAVTAAGAQSVNFTGLTQATVYYPHFVHVDAAGNVSNVANGASFTTQTAADTTAPVIAGDVQVTSVTGTTTFSALLSWPAATDNIAVTGYEYSLNGGSTYNNAGASLSATITLAQETTYNVRTRAYDAAGNRSTPLSRTIVTEAYVEPPITVDPGIAGTVQYIKLPTSQLKLIRITVT